MYRTPNRRRRLKIRYSAFAVLTVGTCAQFGIGCVQAVLASIGATFF